MTIPTKINRRAAITGAAAMPLAAATASMARASAPIKGAAMQSFQRVALGGFDVTTILVGSRAVEGPHQIFGLNVDEATFNDVSSAANLPTDMGSFSLRRPWSTRVPNWFCLIPD